MRYVRVLFLLVLFAPLSAIMGGCGSKDHQKDPWLQHVPTAWTTTPAGHARDAGPFGSVDAGFTTEAEIDAAIDEGFAKFYRVFGYAPPNLAVTINDDYVMWIPVDKKGNGSWVAGAYATGDWKIGVTLWTRTESATDPGPCWIARPPGEYWDVYYSTWRYTAAPLAPALTHELLHVCIGDPNHTNPDWAKLEGGSKKLVPCILVHEGHALEGSDF